MLFLSAYIISSTPVVVLSSTAAYGPHIKFWGGRPRGLFSPKENTVVAAIRAKKARKVCHLQKPLRTHNKRAERRNFLLLLLSLSLLFCALIRGLAGFYGEFSLWSLSGSGWLSHSQRCSRKILAFCHTMLKVQFLFFDGFSCQKSRFQRSEIH